LLPESCRGAVASVLNRHPLDYYTGEACTEQLGVPGPWHARLPHFRLEFTPASGAEIQSEYMVSRQQAPEAIAAIRAIAGKIRPMLLISEIRTVAPDDLWLSTAYQQDTVGLHFSWILDPAGVDSVLPDVEAALAPFKPRPHWGKHFLMPGVDLHDRYPRMDDFRKLAESLDPKGTFRTPFLERWVLG
jgi:xylitol oxidase